MATWRYKISLLLLKKYFTRSLRSLVKYFSPLEEKFRISAWPCNILYYIDTSVLLENKPLVKIHKNCIRDPSGLLCSSFSSAVAAGSA